MKTRRLMTLLLAASTLALPLCARAQETTKTEAAPAQNNALQTRTFALKNISKERILLWLRPQFDAKAPAAFPHIEGVAELKVVPNENALIGRGTTDSLHKIADIISFLDQPISLVECDVHLIFVGRGEIAKVLRPGDGQVGDVPGTISAGITGRGNVDAWILSPNALVMVGKTVTFNNFEVSLPLQRVGVADIKPAITGPMPDVQLKITPTINRDGTVTLAATGLFKTANIAGTEFSAVVNVENDGTVYIVDPQVAASFAAALEKAGAPRDAEIVVAITPHILKRKEEAEKTPATNQNHYS